jgi:hypothetical protein
MGCHSERVSRSPERSEGEEFPLLLRPVLSAVEGVNSALTNLTPDSREEAWKAKPDHLLVLRWHFWREFIEREKNFLERRKIYIAVA